mgnify:CR=1 FL=1
MPTYEYECKSCGHRFDAFQSMSEDPLDTCPECKGQVQRLIAAGAGIIFKGSGFYATDSRKSSGESKSSDASDSSSGGSEGGDKGSGKDTGGDGGKGDGGKKESKTEAKSGSDGGGSKSS